MLNKKGFIRTLEAVIAVILLLSIIYLVTPVREYDIRKPYNIDEAHNAIFTEVLANQTFRDCILNNVVCTVASGCGVLNNSEGQYTYNGDQITGPNCIGNINDFIYTYNKPRGYVYLAEVCYKSASCIKGVLPIEKQIYAESIILTSENPKVFRIYFWEK
tara:strand:- start:36 stop:515 length:480 start_codon:yes stop_codon:yes gene_type:complete